MGQVFQPVGSVCVLTSTLWVCLYALGLPDAVCQKDSVPQKIFVCLKVILLGGFLFAISSLGFTKEKPCCRTSKTQRTGPCENWSSHGFFKAGINYGSGGNVVLPAENTKLFWIFWDRCIHITDHIIIYIYIYGPVFRVPTPLLVFFYIVSSSSATFATTTSNYYYYLLLLL